MKPCCGKSSGVTYSKEGGKKSSDVYIAVVCTFPGINF